MDVDKAKAQREAAAELGRRAVKKDPNAEERRAALERYLGIESRPLPPPPAPPETGETVERAVASRRRRNAAERMREQAGSARDELPRRPRGAE